METVGLEHFVDAGDGALLRDVRDDEFILLDEW
jgi:hypothetical protein